MKLVTLRLVSEGTVVNPVEQAIADEPGVSREVMHHIRALGDGTGTLLCEFSGDADRLTAVLSSHPDVIDYSVAETYRGVFVYVHEEVRGEIVRLLKLKDAHEVIVDEPIEYLDGGAFQVNAVGELSTIQAATDDIPEAVDVVVQRGVHRDVVESNLETAREADVSEIPTFFLFDSGSFATALVGSQDDNVFANALGVTGADARHPGSPPAVPTGG